MRFDEGNDVLEQIALEVLPPAVASQGGWVAAAAKSATPTAAATPAISGVGGGIAVREHHNHWRDFLGSNQIVDDHVGCASPGPLPLIGSDAVEQIENGILLIPGIP